MGFNRGFFVPFAYDGTDAKAGISTSWGAEPHVGVSFSAASEQVGVVADVKFDGGAVNVNDNAYIWVKPFSWLKLQLGKSFDDTLRSGPSYGSWDLFRSSTSVRGDDATFKRLGAIGSKAGKDEASVLTGAILMLDPIENLHIGVGLPISYAGYDEYNTYETIFSKAQVQVGYTIPNVAQIKAQWIGLGKDAHEEMIGIINAAVCVKAIENMTLDFGVYYDIGDCIDKNGGVYCADGDITLVAFWGMPIDALKLNANVEVLLPGLEDDKPTLTAGAGVGYDMGNGWNLGADVRFSKKIVENAAAAVEVGAWASKGIPSGSICVGVQAVFNEDFYGITSGANDTEKAIALPIMFQCFF
jgi:hypothetical protein